MSRRNSSTLHDLYELFVLSPWWVPLPAAALVYLVLSLIVPALNSKDLLIPVFSKMAGNYLSIIILLVGVFSWIGKLWRNKHELNANMSDGIRRKTNDGYVANGLLGIPWWSYPIIGIILCTVFYYYTTYNPVSLGSGFAMSLAPLNIFFIPVILFATGIMAYKTYTIRNDRQVILEKQTSIGSIQQLNWKQFEVLVGEYYRKQGYQVVENANSGADGGVDLRLHQNGTKTIVQCKHWKVAKVGVKDIREFYGIFMHEQAKQAIYITSGIYTEEAKIFVQGKPIVLIEGRQLAAMITSVNGATPAQQTKPQAPAHKPAYTKQAQALNPIELNIPACPKCGYEMILRHARKGDTAGSDFWGCTNFPRCRGTRPIG